MLLFRLSPPPSFPLHNAVHMKSSSQRGGTSSTPTASPHAGSGITDAHRTTPTMASSSGSGGGGGGNKDLGSITSSSAAKEGDQTVFTELRPVPATSAHTVGHSYGPLPSMGQFSNEAGGFHEFYFVAFILWNSSNYFKLICVFCFDRVHAVQICKLDSVIGSELGEITRYSLRQGFSTSDEALPLT